jgi:hypothetical protein
MEGRAWRPVRDALSRTGWIAAELLEETTLPIAIAPTPTPPVPTPITTFAGMVRYVTNTDGMGVRIRPVCEDQARAGLWPEGTRIVIEYARGDCPGWYWVRDGAGQSSWVRGNFLSDRDPTARPDPTPTMSPTPGPDPRLAQLEQRVSRYFSALNAKDYRRAWQECCTPTWRERNPFERFASAFVGVSEIRISRPIRFVAVRPDRITLEVDYSFRSGAGPRNYTLRWVTIAVGGDWLADEAGASAQP